MSLPFHAGLVRWLLRLPEKTIDLHSIGLTPRTTDAVLRFCTRYLINFGVDEFVFRKIQALLFKKNIFMHTRTTASHTQSMLSVIALSYLICPQHVNNTYIGMDVIIEDTLLIESSMNCFILTYISLQQEQVPTCIGMVLNEKKMKVFILMIFNVIIHFRLGLDN